MNIQEMISKMNPNMISKALENIGSSLSPEQLRRVEQAVKSIDKGELNKKLGALNAEELQRELQKNPQLAKQLAQNPELMSKLTDIVEKKRR